MSNRNGIVVAAVALFLLVLFTAYRARSFHYCASLGNRPEARIASGSEPCGENEEPLYWGRLGWFGRAKLAARTVAKSFGGS